MFAQGMLFIVSMPDQAKDDLEAEAEKWLRRAENAEIPTTEERESPYG